MLLKNNETRMREHAAKLLQENGFDLIDCKMFRQDAQYVVRIIADYPGGGITLDDCSRLNRLLYPYLEGMFSDEGFSLEITSPGLDRKLKTLQDFQRVIDRPLGIWLNEPLSGKTYIEGILRNVTKEMITIEGKELRSIPFSYVQCAKQRINYE